MMTSLDLLETLYLFSDTRASESLVLCEHEDVSDLVCCKDPLLPVRPILAPHRSLLGYQNVRLISVNQKDMKSNV